MAYSKDVEAARALATRMHKGQVDKAYLPYITHPERVVARLTTPEAQVVGWLHDTVEDTTLTLEEIEAQFGSETAAAVDAISRRNGEKWGDYLERVARNPMARQVKISDLIDNSNLQRVPHVTMKDVERQKRYNKALRKLLGMKEMEGGKEVMGECCKYCANFDEEYLFCWRYGYHAPKDGKCSSYKPKEVK